MCSDIHQRGLHVRLVPAADNPSNAFPCVLELMHPRLRRPVNIESYSPFVRHRQGLDLA